MADVDAGRTTRRSMLGNGAADIYAVRGTGVAEDASPPLGKKTYREASQFYRFLLTVAGNWVNDATPYEDWIPKVVVEPVPLMLKNFRCTQRTLTRLSHGGGT